MKAKIPIINTAAQQKALDAEINRQLAVHMREHEEDYLSLMLWSMRADGWGKKRIERKREQLIEMLRELEQHYEMPDGGMYISKVKLKEYGVDPSENKNKIFDYEVK